MEMNVIKMTVKKQSHVHEFEAGTHLSDACKNKHTHRFAGVTGEVIPIGDCRHVHEFSANTDFLKTITMPLKVRQDLT